VVVVCFAGEVQEAGRTERLLADDECARQRRRRGRRHRPRPASRHDVQVPRHAATYSYAALSSAVNATTCQRQDRDPSTTTPVVTATQMNPPVIASATKRRGE